MVDVSFEVGRAYGLCRAADLRLLLSRVGGTGGLDEAEFAPGANLCVEGDPGNEVFILLAGEVEVVARHGDVESVVSTEQAGGFIGELAVLDPAPRSARLRAGKSGARVLRLDGEAFSYALKAESSIATHVIRTLAQRLRRESSH